MSRTLSDKDNLANTTLTSNHGGSTGPSSSSGRMTRTKQLMMENKYKQINEEMKRLKESGINSKEVTEKSKLLRKKLKQANDLSKTAFDTASQKCVEYDAEFFSTGSEVNHLVVKSLQVDSQVFDSLIFAEKLRTFIAPDTRIRDSDIDENELQLEDFIDFTSKCSVLINSAPILNYIYGSFDPGEVVIAAKQRRAAASNKFIEPKEEAKKPKSKEGIDENDDLKNGQEVERVYSELKSLYDQKRKPIQFFKTIIKPKSFCETVENIFYSAFLIKEGVVAAKEKPLDGDTAIALLEPQDVEEVARHKEKMKKKKKKRCDDDDSDENESDEESTSNHQSILSFCEADWKAWRVQ